MQYVTDVKYMAQRLLNNFIGIISCSNKCSAIELSQPLVEDLFKLETEGVTTVI